MNSSKITKRMPFAAVLLASACAAATALAGEQVRTETVMFGDLNLNTSQGVQALYGRIHAAAWRVCDTPSVDPFYQSGARKCARSAEAKAIEGLNMPQLTALYRAKSGEQTHPLSASR